MRRPGAADGRRRGRSVPALYGAVSLVLVAGALTFALSSPAPSTPPLAEVAPAPQDQIDVERVEQSSRFGEGAGGEGDCVPGDPGCEGAAERPDAATSEPSTPPASPSPTDAAESWPCRNGGLTQTDDPQSPPCIGARFAGDNGGATATGVTATQVRVAWPTSVCGDRPCNRDGREEYAILAHFNRRYELYARSITIELVEASGYEDTPAGARALAQEIASRDVFASLPYTRVPREVLHRELARHGVVSVLSPHRPATTEAYLRELHPYVWGVLPSIDEAMEATAALVCGALVDRPATHAGATLAADTRRFGIVSERSDGERLDASRLLTGLDACGAPYEVIEHDRDAAEAGAALETSMRRFAGDGVTTVACVCHSGGLLNAADAAQASGYQPEWLLTGHVSDEDVSKLHRDQRANTFGLTSDFRWLSSPVGTTSGSRRYDEHFWFHAMKDGDPDVETTSNMLPFYQQLLPLASGIQWAGAELSPESFGDALVGLEFANPGVGEPRWFQPSVSLGPSDHGWNSDFALLWWRNSSAEEERVSSGFKGQPCYVGAGLRYTAGTVPADADQRFFDPEAGCR